MTMIQCPHVIYLISFKMNAKNLLLVNSQKNTQMLRARDHLLEFRVLAMYFR